MVEHVVVFTGSKKDYEAVLVERVPNAEDTIPFMELIQHYNARLRPNESGVAESALFEKMEIDNCVVRADDYGSVLEHVLSNFMNIVALNYEIGILYLHNPPKRVMQSITTVYSGSIEHIKSEYRTVNREILRTAYKKLNIDILGQDACKKDIISGLYRLTATISDRPVVLMLYGPSGVGKTETAKSVSKSFGGELLRVQFSMMQTNEAYNYVFGAEHSKGSFARDMLSRESNVILIDEFDKVNPLFYNAFYELFDEGRYVDSNYDVDVRNTIFFCTCNFSSEEEIKKALGPAMYSRIGCCIKYSDIGIEQKWIIIENWYREIVKRISEEEQVVISQTDILEWFKDNANRYDNIRLLKNKLENAIFDELTEHFIVLGK